MNSSYFLNPSTITKSFPAQKLPTFNSGDVKHQRFHTSLQGSSDRKKVLNDIMYKKLRPREHVTVAKVRSSRSPSIKKSDILNVTVSSKLVKESCTSSSLFEVFF